MSNDTIDLLIEFFEQERNYARESLASKAHSKRVELILNKRIDWFTTLIGTLQESKTEKGINILKGAIEREKKRLKQKETIK
jgi:hypothetical protein